MKITWFFFGALFYSFSAFAVITLEPISGVSNVVIDPITTNVQVVAGFNGECSSPSTGVCNTCVNTTVEPCGGTDAGCCGGQAGGDLAKCQMCNTRAVTSTTVLTIPFVSDTTDTGLPVLTVGNDGNEILSDAGVGTGGRFLFTKPWSQLCPIITDGCSCETIRDGGCGSFTGTVLPRTLNVGVQGGDSISINFRLYRQSQVLASAGGEGALSSYSIYPGDEKVYIEEPVIIGYSEGTKSTAVSQIRVFIGTGSFNNAYTIDDGTGTGSTFDPATLNVDANGLDQVVDGLENNEIYHFRTASIDEAGNIYAFMDNQYLIDQGCTDPSLEGGINGANLCKYAGQPSRVLGLLTEDMNCFVATAAYGSSLDPHIDTFRDFRFKVLLRSELGKKLNYAYYNYGPKLARFIKNHEWARTASRAILWPTWGLISLSLYLHLNLWQTLLLFLCSGGLIFASGHFLVRTLLRRGVHA